MGDLMVDGGLDLDALVADDCVAVDTVKANSMDEVAYHAVLGEGVGLAGCEGDQKEEEDCGFDD